jgi:hypothetical protein
MTCKGLVLYRRHPIRHPEDADGAAGLFGEPAGLMAATIGLRAGDRARKDIGFEVIARCQRRIQLVSRQITFGALQRLDKNLGAPDAEKIVDRQTVARKFSSISLRHLSTAGSSDVYLTCEMVRKFAVAPGTPTCSSNATGSAMPLWPTMSGLKPSFWESRRNTAAGFGYNTGMTALALAAFRRST